MPIPSIVSSSSSNAIPLPVVTITTPSLDEIVHQEDSKCKQQSAIKSQANAVSGNSMETEVSYNTKQHVKPCHKINSKVVLLHARREEDDKVANINEDRLRPVCVGGLYAGSVFRGTQKCGTASYEVNVELLVRTVCVYVCLCKYKSYLRHIFSSACGYEGKQSLRLLED